MKTYEYTTGELKIMENKENSEEKLQKIQKQRLIEMRKIINKLDKVEEKLDKILELREINSLTLYFDGLNVSGEEEFDISPDGLYDNEFREIKTIVTEAIKPVIERSLTMSRDYLLQDLRDEIKNMLALEDQRD